METQTYKIITLGSYGVGKTCLLLKATSDIESFPNGYQCTIGVDFKTKILQHKEKGFKLVLWDTAGQERFFHINRLYYKDCNAAMLVYDVTNRESFERIIFFLNDFKNCSPGPYVFILLGNKKDCVDREVDYEEGKQMADTLGLCFLECSAYTGENLEEVFVILIELIQEANTTSRDTSQSIIITEKKKNKQVSKCC